MNFSFLYEIERFLSYYLNLNNVFQIVFKMQVIQIDQILTITVNYSQYISLNTFLVFILKEHK